ncbi:cystatin-C [Monodelphis domestica]|uniref:Cystatin-like n=1 Tax=Monodelphis domestica TaxID=13616 RepID=A0A5F8GXR8_MONDO|nr:cystatin-C [Monodelphis domestica]
MAGSRLSLVLLPLLLIALVCAVHAERKPRLVGGITEANENEEGVQRAVNFAISEYNKASNDKFGHRIVRVVRAQKQLVAGIKYILEVEISRTTCTKSVTDFSSCPLHEDPTLKKHSICNFVVYFVPWLGKISLIKNECKII